MVSAWLFGLLCLMLTMVVSCAANKNVPAVGDPSSAGQQPVRVHTHLNLPYDKHPQTVMHLFVPEGVSRPPLVVFIHGGGWNAGNLDQYDSHCIRLACQGLATTTIEHRFLSEQVSLADIIADVVRACSFLQCQSSVYGYDGKKMFLVGSSAGGHLALVVGARAKECAEAMGLPPMTPPVGVVAQCPVTTFELTDPNDEGRVRRHGIAANLPLEQVSPMHIVAKAFPAVQVQHGDADDTIPAQDSRQFVDRLVAAGMAAEYVELAGVGHGYGYNLASDSGRKGLDLTMRFIRRQLDAAQAPAK